MAEKISILSVVAICSSILHVTLLTFAIFLQEAVFSLFWQCVDMIINISCILLMYSWNEKYYFQFCGSCIRCYEKRKNLKLKSDDNHISSFSPGNNEEMGSSHLSVSQPLPQRSSNINNKKEEEEMTATHLQFSQKATNDSSSVGVSKEFKE